MSSKTHFTSWRGVWFPLAAPSPGAGDCAGNSGCWGWATCCHPKLDAQFPLLPSLTSQVLGCLSGARPCWLGP